MTRPRAPRGCVAPSRAQFEDPEFDSHSAVFDAMRDDLEQLGIGVFSSLQTQRDYFDNQAKLAVTLDDFYNGQFHREWQGENPASGARELADSARYGRERWKYLNDVVRRSMAQVMLDTALTPVREYVNERAPEVEKKVDERNQAVADFDSYRRRLAAIEKSGKADTDQGKAMTLKRDRARDRFEESNAEVKALLVTAKLERDKVLEDAAVAIAACQLELMYMTANYLQETVSALPPAKAQQVDAVRLRIRQIVNEGGPDIATEKTGALTKAFNLATGKALPSDYREEEEKAAKMKALQDQRREEVARQQQAMAASPGVVSPMGVEVGAGGAQWVIAEYDCSAEADDELSFQIGDKIKVTRQDDSEWWEGECRGKTGVFPKNYVRMATPQEL